MGCGRIDLGGVVSCPLYDAYSTVVQPEALLCRFTMFVLLTWAWFRWEWDACLFER